MIEEIDEKEEEQVGGGMVVDMKSFGKKGNDRFEIINNYGTTKLSCGSEKEAVRIAKQMGIDSKVASPKDYINFLKDKNYYNGR